MDNIRAIRNDDDLEWAIAEVSQYFENQPDPHSADGVRLDVLSVLIDVYEDKHYSIEALEPVELLKAHMETGAAREISQDCSVLAHVHPKCSTKDVA